MHKIKSRRSKRRTKCDIKNNFRSDTEITVKKETKKTNIIK